MASMFVFLLMTQQEQLSLLAWEAKGTFLKSTPCFSLTMCHITYITSVFEQGVKNLDFCHEYDFVSSATQVHFWLLCD